MRIFITASILFVFAWETALAEPAATPSTPASDTNQPKTVSPLPIEQQPYRIEVHATVDPEARLDSSKIREIFSRWEILVQRFVGAPWVLKIQTDRSALTAQSLDDFTPELFNGLGAEFDKIWILRIGIDSDGDGLLLTGREYDVATRRLGPIQRRMSAVDVELPRTLLAFSIDLFNPVAVISGEEGGRALLTVRGASVAPASPLGAVVQPGTIFVPLRVTTARDGSPRILTIPYTYLKVETIEGAVARCEFVKGISDPLSKRWSRPYSFAAVGIKPSASPLRLRFVSRKEKDEIPVAGYILTVREVPDGNPREVGLTDRSGRIAVKPQYAKSLVVVRLIAGSAEPLFEAPMMPGDSDAERKILVQLLPLAVALETKLDSLRDQIVDLVALRSRLESRMKARLDGEDWKGLEETIKEFRALTPRDVMAEKLKSLQDEAARQQAQNKQPVLTRTSKARLDELQALIDRYLDDDGVNAYAEAATLGKADAIEIEKAKSKRRGAVVGSKPAIPAASSPSAPATTSAPQLQAKPAAKEPANSATATPKALPAPKAAQPAPKAVPAPSPRPAPKSNVPF